MSGGGTYGGSNNSSGNYFPSYQPNYPQAFSPMDSGATFGNTTAPTNSSIVNPPMMDMGTTFGSAMNGQYNSLAQNAANGNFGVSDPNSAQTLAQQQQASMQGAIGNPLTQQQQLASQVSSYSPASGALSGVLGGLRGQTQPLQTSQMMDAGALFGSQQSPQQPASGYSDAQVTNALKSYGQDPNSASGQQWMQAIQSGQATPQDMIKALSSGQANPNFGQPVTPPMGTPQTPMQTKGIVLSEGPRMPARSLINFPNYGPNIPGNPPGNPTTPGNPTIPGTPPNPITAPSGQRIPYTPYPGYPGLPPMPANNAPQFYGPSYLTDSITGKLFQMTPQFAQYRDALAGDPNSFRFN